ncbi:MAG: CHAT domain-containing tetratricopeptide repeat protein [Fodinibius sp.]|nr:CHAT domain-containing tetratricopeptide repeat protein [Fodinibius sp.]
MAQSLQLADSLFAKGKHFDKSGNKEQSEFYYREAYNIYRDFQDTASWLEAGKEYASAMMWRSKHDQAMALYQKLLDVDHPTNDAYNRGDLYNSMGLLSKRRGEIEEAKTYYQKSLPLSKKSGDDHLIGVVYSNLGGISQREGNLSKALELQKKSLPYFRKANLQRNIAITLGNIGGIYADLSLYNKALEYYNQSLEIRKKIGSVYLLANIYHRLGSIQRQLGNFDQALISLQKALEFSKKAGTPNQTATILNGIGLLYKELGEHEKALDYYQQSLSIHQETSGPTEIAVLNNNIGQLYWEQDKKEKASEFFQRSFELRKVVGNPYHIATALNKMTNLHIDRQNYDQASAYATQLKTIGDSTNSYNILETAENYFGKINDRQGNEQSALKHYKKAYAYSKYLPKPNRLTSLKNLSRQYYTLGSDSALTYGQKAIDIIEQHRSKAGATSELKSGYFGQYADFYDELASWTLQLSSDLSRAYQLVEQAKARSLSDELAKASQNIDQQLPEEVRIERQNRQERISNLYSKIKRATTQEKRTQLRDKIRTAELDLAAYENSLRDQYPELKSLKSPDVISLQRAQQITPDQTAVLEYALADNSLIMFLITQNDVHVEQFSLPDNQQLAEKLTSWVADFKDAILSNANRNTLRATSDKLYNALLKPFEEQLQNFENLIIVPDGALAYLPFEAISQGDQYLIENFRIKYEPSLTSLTLLQDPEPVKRKDLLAVAGSQISEQNERSYRSAGLSALPSTIIEVDSIASHFREVSTLKDEQVSEQAFKDLLRQNQYQYIHMATHGVINEDEPSRSGLALSAEGKITASSTEDGMLRSSEIFGLNINSDMVVLSACNTGLGKLVSGEGILGMQRSFFYAGTSTVVVSLWNVYDRSTASFMNEFYKSLLNNISGQGWTNSMLRWIGWDESIPYGRKAKAMRQAKLNMIKHPLFNHPVYWAPFIVVGR